jgi:hypothetical protein
MRNTVHLGDFYQMLKAVPHNGDTGFAIAFAALEPAQLRDPAHRLVQVGGLVGAMATRWIRQYKPCHSASSSSTVQGASGTARASMVAYKMRHAITL